MTRVFLLLLPDGSISVAECEQFDLQHYQMQWLVVYLPINGLINFLAKREEKRPHTLARLMESFCRLCGLLLMNETLTHHYSVGQHNSN